MNVAILYQSLRGGTERAANNIGQEFLARDCAVGVYPVGKFDAQFVLRADLLLIGSWTDGLFGLGAKPGQMSKIAKLPSIAHKPTAVFVTYEISPSKSLKKLSDWAEAGGAQVVAAAGFHRRRLDQGVADFVDAALEAVAPATA